MRAKPSSNYGPDTEPGSANRTFSIGGHVLNAPKPVPGLYLVATPIGHLGRVLHRLRGDAGIAGGREWQDQADLDLPGADRKRLLLWACRSLILGRSERIRNLAAGARG